MREIKCKAWNITRKQMSAAFTLPDLLSCSVDKLHEWSISDVIEWIQYTGLKDRNGKEIYESDIVKCVNGDTGEVIWEEHDCCFNITDYYNSSNDYPTMAFIEGEPFEILGNIYENPELLSQPDSEAK